MGPWVISRFLQYVNRPYTGPIMVQLRHVLKRNANYIWHAFEKHVSLFIYLTVGSGCTCREGWNPCFGWKYT